MLVFNNERKAVFMVVSVFTSHTVLSFSIKYRLAKGKRASEHSVVALSKYENCICVESVPLRISAYL